MVTMKSGGSVTGDRCSIWCRREWRRWLGSRVLSTLPSFLEDPWKTLKTNFQEAWQEKKCQASLADLLQERDR